MRRIILALLLGWPYHLAAQTELPRAVPSTTLPAVTRTVRLTASGDLQAALDSAKAGDAIELPCTSDTYTANHVLRRSSVVLRSACWAQLPVGRITPADAVALKLPRITTPNNLPALATEGPVHDVAIVGLEVISAPTGTTNLIALGSDAQTTLAEVPQRLVLDRLYVHGTPTTTLRRCWALNSGATAIINSYCADAHEAGADAQAIMGWTGPGPYLIRNNYLEAASENIMFGGGDPRTPGLVPSDITIQGNHLTKPLSWLGGPWLIKNLFELKNARRVLVEGNVLENNWSGGQDGIAVVLKSTNQDGSCPWCGTSHVTLRLNVVRNTGGGIALTAAPEQHPADPMHHVSVTDNVLANIRTETFTGPGAVFTARQQLTDILIAHNTAVNDSSHYFAALVLGQPESPPIQRFSYRDNLSTAGSNFGLYGDNTGMGRQAVDLYAPGGLVAGNVFGGMTQRDDLSSYDQLYPPGNWFRRSTAELGLVAPSVLRSLGTAPIPTLLAALALAPTSPYRGKATDGRDPGADIPAVLAATAHAVDRSVVVAPVPTITLAQLRAAILAIDKVVGPTGRENAATKAALAPVAVYLHALLGATP